MQQNPHQPQPDPRPGDEAVADAAVHRSRVLPAAPDLLWQALTDDEQLSEWFGGEVQLDPRPGGAGNFRTPEGDRRARIERAEPSRRLTWRWWSEEDGGEAASQVDVVLVPVPGGTRIDVTETPVAAVASVEWALRLEALAPLAASRACVLLG